MTQTWVRPPPEAAAAPLLCNIESLSHCSQYFSNILNVSQHVSKFPNFSQAATSIHNANVHNACLLPYEPGPSTVRVGRSRVAENSQTQGRHHALRGTCRRASPPFVIAGRPLRFDRASSIPRTCRGCAWHQVRSCEGSRETCGRRAHLPCRPI